MSETKDFLSAEEKARIEEEVTNDSFLTSVINDINGEKDVLVREKMKEKLRAYVAEYEKKANSYIERVREVILAIDQEAETAEAGLSEREKAATEVAEAKIAYAQAYASLVEAEKTLNAITKKCAQTEQNLDVLQRNAKQYAVDATKLAAMADRLSEAISA